MTRRSRQVAWVVVAALAGGLLMACGDDGGGGAAEEDPPPARVEAVRGSNLRQVTLTAEAAERLDLRLVPVGSPAANRLEIPYGAVLYDPDGKTWAFVRTAEMTFVRRPITVLSISGDVAVLSQGPPVGTDVVTVGAAQLYGAELGLGAH